MPRPAPPWAGRLLLDHGQGGVAKDEARAAAATVRGCALEDPEPCSVVPNSWRKSPAKAARP